MISNVGGGICLSGPAVEVFERFRFGHPDPWVHPGRKQERCRSPTGAFGYSCNQWGRLTLADPSSFGGLIFHRAAGKEKIWPVKKGRERVVESKDRLQNLGSQK